MAQKIVLQIGVTWLEDLQTWEAHFYQVGGLWFRRWLKRTCDTWMRPYGKGGNACRPPGGVSVGG